LKDEGYMTNHYDVIIIGAGAAGLMAASTASKKNLRVALIEHSPKIGEKIRISGGGRCNFTNIHATAENYISHNPDFAKPALTTYSQHDFIKLVESYKIAYHEKTLGQLFCDGSSKQIIQMLLNECAKGHVDTKTNCSVQKISKTEHFNIDTNLGSFTSHALIIATGGLSIPQIGASDFGYKIARQFGLKVLATKPGLVPLKVAASHQDFCINLSGISQNAIACYQQKQFRENILFTHRGLSGPAILQISSYLEKFVNTHINIDLLPNIDLKQIFQNKKIVNKVSPIF
jgi:predicted Rossmann fold flavoprotein